MAEQNQICLDDENFDWSVKAIMIKNHPYIAYEILKIYFWNKILNRKDCLWDLDISPSFCNKKQL